MPEGDPDEAELSSESQWQGQWQGTAGGTQPAHVSSGRARHADDLPLSLHPTHPTPITCDQPDTHCVGEHPEPTTNGPEAASHRDLSPLRPSEIGGGGGLDGPALGTWAEVDPTNMLAQRSRSTPPVSSWQDSGQSPGPWSRGATVSGRPMEDDRSSPAAAADHHEARHEAVVVEARAEAARLFDQATRGAAAATSPAISPSDARQAVAEVEWQRERQFNDQAKAALHSKLSVSFPS